MSGSSKPEKSAPPNSLTSLSANSTSILVGQPRNSRLPAELAGTALNPIEIQFHNVTLALASPTIPPNANRLAPAPS